MTISIAGITKRYGGLVAVNEVSFDAAPGQITSLIGPNGAGKTTLLNLLSGTVKPDSGSVHLQGEDLTQLESYVRAQKGMARTYQNPQLFDDMTVLETVQVGAHQTGTSGFFSTMLRTPSVRREEADIDHRARAALLRVGLPESLYERHADELAYGLQRRVEIARALAMQPRVILLDEPAAGLNAPETEEIAFLFRTLADEGLIVVLVEHDMHMVMSISDKVVVMNFGQKIAEGSVEEVQANPSVIDAYLGAPELESLHA
jgi:branched-chain amino acid transport system ATP-binding protein